MEILQEILAPYLLATLGSIVLNLLLAFALGLVIAAVYRWTHAGLAEKSMTDTLIMLCMLVAGFFKKVKYGGGDNLTLFSRQTPPVSVQNAEKHL